MNPRVKMVEARADYTLEITFANGEIGVYDCAPLLDFGVFREFRELGYFKQARADGGTVVWPHEQDICPDTLYEDSRKLAGVSAPVADTEDQSSDSARRLAALPTLPRRDGTLNTMSLVNELRDRMD